MSERLQRWSIPRQWLRFSRALDPSRRGAREADRYRLVVVVTTRTTARRRRRDGRTPQQGRCRATPTRPCRTAAAALSRPTVCRWRCSSGRGAGGAPRHLQLSRRLRTTYRTSAKRTSGTRHRCVLVSFWAHFGIILGTFWAHFGRILLGIFCPFCSVLDNVDVQNVNLMMAGHGLWGGSSDVSGIESAQHASVVSVKKQGRPGSEGQRRSCGRSAGANPNQQRSRGGKVAGGSGSSFAVKRAAAVRRYNRTMTHGV